MMTVRRVRTIVKWIDAHKSDDEMAHVAEDNLYSKVLKAIAAGKCEDPVACAAECLKTQKLDFARWCA